MCSYLSGTNYSPATEPNIFRLNVFEYGLQPVAVSVDSQINLSILTEVLVTLVYNIFPVQVSTSEPMRAGELLV